jgi:acetolactate synthase-1/2/3 large subunit
VRDKNQVVSAIEQALATDGPALIDFIVEQEENVYPMVAPGGSIGDMLRRPQPEGVGKQEGGDSK